MPPSGGSSTSPPAWITRNRLHYTSYARNVFKRTSQSRTSYLLFACLFYVVLLSTCSVSCTNAQSTSLSFRENIDCTYASSTCTTCANVCVHRQFHPLFPSRCHPSFSVSCLFHIGCTACFLMAQPSTNCLFITRSLQSLSPLSRSHTKLVYFPLSFRKGHLNTIHQGTHKLTMLITRNNTLLHIHTKMKFDLLHTTEMCLNSCRKACVCVCADTSWISSHQ